MPPPPLLLRLSVCLALLTVQTARGQPPPGAKPCRVDRYGDPLPQGALDRLGTLRFRHEGSVYSLAFSPDDKLLAGAQFMNGRIILWDSRTGQKRHEVRTPYQITSLTFSPDGKELAARSLIAEIGFWNAATGETLREFTPWAAPSKGLISGHGMPLVFAPDGKTVFVQERSRFDESLAAFDAATGKKLRDFGSAGHLVKGLALSPDGKTLALGASKPSVRLYDAASGRVVWTMNEHGGKDTDTVAFRPDGKVLASGSVDRIVLSNPDNGKTLDVLTAPMGYIVGLAFTPDGRTLLVGSYDGKVHVWDVAGKKERYRLDAHGGWGQALALSHDGKTVAFATRCNVIRLWDVATGKERFPDDAGHETWVRALAFSWDGKQIISADSNLQVRRWETGTGQTLARFRAQGVHSLYPMLTADGMRLAILDRGSGITRIWDTHTVKAVLELRPIGDEKVYGAALAPDGQGLITASRHTARLWDVNTGRRIRTHTFTAEMFQSHRDYGGNEWPWRLALSPGGKTIALEDPASWGMWLYDSEKSRPRFNLEEPSGRIWSAVFSPDGRTVATQGESDRRMAVCLWEVATGELVFRWLGPKNRISAIVMSPDGRFVAVASEPYSWRKDVEELEIIRVWDTATGREVGQFRGHDSFVSALAFSPDGTKLLAGLSNSTILVWDVAALTQRAGFALREISALWDDLGGDARKARRAVWELAAVPRRAIPFLRERLRPVPRIERQRLAASIAALDSDQFREREEATRKLELLADVAEPALRTALAKEPSPEARWRIKHLLSMPQQPPSKIVRALRAVEALEKIGTAEARPILQTLAGGTPEAWLTREAKAALERLARQSTTP